MAPISMTFNGLTQISDITQRQITRKWYKIKLYLHNGRPITSRIWSIERRHFQWPWTTPNLVFKVTPFFDTEYFTNGYRYGHSYYRKRIWNRSFRMAPVTNFKVTSFSVTLNYP